MTPFLWTLFRYFSKPKLSGIELGVFMGSVGRPIQSIVRYEGDRRSCTSPDSVCNRTDNYTSVTLWGKTDQYRTHMGSQIPIPPTKSPSRNSQSWCSLVRPSSCTKCLERTNNVWSIYDGSHCEQLHNQTEYRRSVICTRMVDNSQRRLFPHVPTRKYNPGAQSLESEFRLHCWSRLWGPCEGSRHQVSMPIKSSNWW